MADYHLIGQDASVAIFLGGVANGASATYATTSILAIGDARNIRVREPLDTVDVSGIGDTRRKIRAKRGSTDVEVEQFVLSSGHTLKGKLGYYAKVEIKELSSLGTAQSWAGIITNWDFAIGDDEQTESFTLSCDAETA